MDQIKENEKVDEKEITSRLRDQVSNLEAAVSAAKREAVLLFRELESQTQKAKNIASSLNGNDDTWARGVSKLMDILGNCRGRIEGMEAIGLLHNIEFSWEVEKVFTDGSENDQVSS